MTPPHPQVVLTLDNFDWRNSQSPWIISLSQSHHQPTYKITLLPFLMAEWLSDIWLHCLMYVTTRIPLVQNLLVCPMGIHIDMYINSPVGLTAWILVIYTMTWHPFLATFYHPQNSQVLSHLYVHDMCGTLHLWHWNNKNVQYIACIEKLI